MIETSAVKYNGRRPAGGHKKLGFEAILQLAYRVTLCSVQWRIG